MKERTLYCRCGFKKMAKFDFPAEDLDTTCPECGNRQMYVKMQLSCGENSCKRYTVVNGDPTWANWNFYNNKYGTFDIRNFGFVCPDHQKAYERHYERITDRKYDLEKGHTLI